MARKPKALSPAEPKKRKMTQEEQSELFIRTARELGVDETGAEFERAFKTIAPQNRPNHVELRLARGRSNLNVVLDRGNHALSHANKRQSFFRVNLAIRVNDRISVQIFDLFQHC